MSSMIQRFLGSARPDANPLPRTPLSPALRRQVVRPAADPAPFIAVADNKPGTDWLEMRRAAGWPALEPCIPR